MRAGTHRTLAHGTSTHIRPERLGRSCNNRWRDSALGRSPHKIPRSHGPGQRVPRVAQPLALIVRGEPAPLGHTDLAGVADQLRLEVCCHHRDGLAPGSNGRGQHATAGRRCHSRIERDIAPLHRQNTRRKLVQVTAIRQATVRQQGDADAPIIGDSGERNSKFVEQASSRSDNTSGGPTSCRANTSGATASITPANAANFARYSCSVAGPSRWPEGNKFCTFHDITLRAATDTTSAGGPPTELRAQCRDRPRRAACPILGPRRSRFVGQTAGAAFGGLAEVAELTGAHHPFDRRAGLQVAGQCHRLGRVVPRGREPRRRSAHPPRRDPRPGGPR